MRNPISPQKVLYSTCAKHGGFAMRVPSTYCIVPQWLLTVLFVVGLGTACSSSQSDDGELNSDQSDSQGNLGEDDAHEGNGQENFVDSGDKKEGAEVNSDTSASGEGGGGDAVAGDATPPANGGGGNSLFNNSGASGANAAAPAETPTNAGAGPAANSPDTANATAQAATPTAASEPSKTASAPASKPAVNAPAAAAPAPAANTAMTPRSNGRVRYVKEGGVQVVNAPNGSPVMTLEQGEHPVTWEENGWLKITDGLYVPVDSMSTKGVARARGQLSWSH